MKAELITRGLCLWSLSPSLSTAPQVVIERNQVRPSGSRELSAHCRKARGCPWKGQGLWEGCCFSQAAWNTRTECAWAPRLEGWQGEDTAQGLGKGISPGWKRPRIKWPSIFHLGLRG